MRVSLHTLGTRGDVQPYLALAIGLMRRGHDVQLCAPEQFEELARTYGIPFVALPGEIVGLIDTPAGKSAIADGNGFSAGFKLLKSVRPMMRRLLDAEWRAAQAFGPGIIVHHPKSIASPHMAQALNCRTILGSPIPGFTPTSAFPSPLFPYASLGPLNAISHKIAAGAGQFLFRRTIREWRSQTLKGSKSRAEKFASAGTLYAYSPLVLPVPPDWPDDVLVSGFWLLDTPAWTPDAALASFLANGDRPIYVGFGSMPGIDPVRMTRVVIEALAIAGRRGLLAIGGGALSTNAFADHVHVVHEAPHDQLLPLTSATIHHGGAGTTAASLRAGLPTAICPFFGDQPFWARRVAALGVGPRPLNRKKLSATVLAEAIIAMDDPDMRRKAAALGIALRREDGVASAVQFIEAAGENKSGNGGAVRNPL